MQPGPVPPLPNSSGPSRLENISSTFQCLSLSPWPPPADLVRQTWLLTAAAFPHQPPGGEGNAEAGGCPACLKGSLSATQQVEPMGALTASGEPPEAAGLRLGRAQGDGRTWKPLGRGSFPDRLWELGTVAEAVSCGGMVTGKFKASGARIKGQMLILITPSAITAPH